MYWDFLYYLLCVSAFLPRPGNCLTRLQASPTDGYFFSPGYPQKYGHNLKQEWLLETNDQSHVINFEVVDSQIEASSACSYDYVQVHDGRDADAPVIGRFCGNKEPSYVSTGSSMFVVFSTDAFGQYMGFYIKFYSSPPPTTTAITTQIETSTTPASTMIPVSTSSSLVTTEEPSLGESRTAESTLSTTSIVGILIAVVFCLTVVLVIVGSVCIHNANKVDVQPKRSKAKEQEIYKTIFGSADFGQTRKPRKPFQFPPESDLSSRSTTSTNVINTSATSGFSSGVPCSPSTLHPIIQHSNMADHHYHSLSPVPEVTKSMTMSVDETDGRQKVTSQQNYAYLDMMELSPRRLVPISMVDQRATSSPRDTSKHLKVNFMGETSESEGTGTPRSDANPGLPNALRKAREARRARYKQCKKSAEEFERGHANTKHSMINRIDLVRCGVLTGEGHVVPRVDNEDIWRKMPSPEYYEH